MQTNGFYALVVKFATGPIKETVGEIFNNRVWLPGQTTPFLPGKDGFDILKHVRIPKVYHATKAPMADMLTPRAD
jgi:hypothetical protein